MKRLVLASGSPRRKELMSLLNTPFEIIVSAIEEVVDPTLPPETIVESLAKQKALAVFQNNPDAIVIGADTIVVCNQEILGKPKDAQDGKRMMEMLKNNTHQVMTGIAIVCQDQITCFHETAKVYFDEIPQNELGEYLQTNEPYDKAGGYAIQGWAAKYIRRIEGDYYSIVGLPVHTLYQYLKQMM